MIEGLKIIERIGENGRVTHFKYKSLNAWWLTDKLESATKEQLDDAVRESEAENKKWKEEEEAEKKRRALLTDAERKSEDEYRKSLYERMQSEQEVMFREEDEE